MSAQDSATRIEPGTWVIDPNHTSIEAVARHLMVSKVRGRFQEFSGSVEIGEDPADSSIDVTIVASSINTGAPDRDAHLRSGDFLDADNHPELTYHSERIELLDDTRFRAPGELTIRGITRPVTLDGEFLGVFQDPWGQTKAGFTATTELDREEYDITWNQALEAGGVLVGAKLKVELDVQLTPKS